MTDAELAAAVAVHIAAHPDDPVVQDFAAAYLRLAEVAAAAMPGPPPGVPLPPPAVSAL